MKTRMHKALSLVVSIAFVCALAPRWQIATVQAQPGAPVGSTTLPDHVAFQVDSDVNFVGTVTDIGGGIGFAY